MRAGNSSIFVMVSSPHSRVAPAMARARIESRSRKKKRLIPGSLCSRAPRFRATETIERGRCSTHTLFSLNRLRSAGKTAPTSKRTHAGHAGTHVGYNAYISHTRTHKGPTRMNAARGRIIARIRPPFSSASILNISQNQFSGATVVRCCWRESLRDR